MVGELRKGKAAIREAAEAAKSGGSFKPFLPRIFWKDNKEERYILFLTPVDESPQLDLIDFIKTEGGYPEMVVARTDPYIGEKIDKFEKTWDATPRITHLAIAVELEPTLELVNGRQKPNGFEVMTREYSRKILDDEGNVTEETEEVLTPVIGLVAQSPANFFSVLEQVDNTDFPVHETPIKVTRVGKDSNTTYDIKGYEGQDLDLTNLFEYLGGVTYLGDQLEPLLEEIDPDNPLDSAYKIGEVLLDKKVEELVDEDRYEELFEGQDESMDKFNKKGKKGKKEERKAPARNARPSQRRKAEPEESADEPAETEATKESPREDKLAALEARAKARTKK